jgi:DNA/RNA endonuclease YhcR with UshA esterase domain
MNAGASQNQGAFCPSCERFIGPADVCPYCDADSARPPIMRTLRCVSLVLAFVGLGFLYLAATTKELPTQKISEITPMMNFARSQVAGSVQKDPYVGEKKGLVDYISFPINDGSGELRVVAYGAVAKSLKDRKLLPVKGDFVEVTGDLDVTADGNPKLRLDATEKLRIRKDARAQ